MVKDKGVILVLVQRIWQAAAGAVTLFCVAYFLSPVEQGYYYTLSNLAALYMALDMGLSAVLVQFAAKEFIGLSWGRAGKVKGAYPSRFLNLIRLSLRWYLSAALIFLFIYPAGVAFIGKGHGNLSYDWKGPWALLVFATSVCLMNFGSLSLTEGSGRVAEVYLIRLVQGVAGAIGVWTVLATGGGLYAVGMMQTISAVVVCTWVFMRRRYMILQAFKEKTADFHWKTEVWPLQWRVGGTWIAGYAMVFMHVPVLFHIKGPVSAGRMGITMTVANMLSLLALSWVTARIPAMSRAVSLKDWKGLDQTYWPAFRMSCITFIAGAAGFMAVRFALQGTSFSSRFLPINETAELLLAMGFYHVSGLFALYLRAHFKEPFLIPALTGAALTAVATILAAYSWGSQGVVAVLVVINLLYFFPIALLMLIYFRKKWHAPVYGTATRKV